jgi:hypothetical protein
MRFMGRKRRKKVLGGLGLSTAKGAVWMSILHLWRVESQADATTRGGEADFSATLDGACLGKKNRQQQQQKQNAGVLRCARNDMRLSWGEWILERQRQRQRQKQEQPQILRLRGSQKSANHFAQNDKVGNDKVEVGKK